MQRNSEYGAAQLSRVICSTVVYSVAQTVHNSLKGCNVAQLGAA